MVKMINKIMVQFKNKLNENKSDCRMARISFVYQCTNDEMHVLSTCRVEDAT